ncbi:MAG: betaine reductase, partial [Lachnospiraceae bacterium]|nr:betaine reductase [Lachnospiraceae bacterium]
MKLEIGNFHVREIAFGDRLSYADGVLTINKDEALAFVKEDSRITEAELHIVKPGDMVRLCPVKEAIEPRVRPDGRGLFPGYTSEIKQAGEGVIHALKNCSVLVVGKHWGGFQDGLIDMGGEGQKYTYFGGLNNIVLVADTNEDFEKHEQQKKNDALRRAGHRLAEFIGAAVKDLKPEDTDVYETKPVSGRGEEIEKLPGVVYVMQPQSQMEEIGYNDLVYGWDMNRFVPTFMQPTEVLDGALVSGSF